MHSNMLYIFQFAFEVFLTINDLYPTTLVFSVYFFKTVKPCKPHLLRTYVLTALILSFDLDEQILVD